MYLLVHSGYFVAHFVLGVVVRPRFYLKIVYSLPQRCVVVFKVDVFVVLLAVFGCQLVDSII